jgi:acyl-CoA thioester hydrolase
MVRAFTSSFRAGWGEMDYNGHMANTAYLDFAADARFRYFEACGFTAVDFERERIGPVVKRDVIEYRSEIRLQEEFTVALELAGISTDGSRFRLRNTFLKADDHIAAVVTTDAGWLSLERRRLTVPPQNLLSALDRLARTEDFEDLPSSMRGPAKE